MLTTLGPVPSPPRPVDDRPVRVKLLKPALVRGELHRAGDILVLTAAEASELCNWGRAIPLEARR